MLSTNALDSALPLTERFDAQNIVVKPVSGTPLEKLVGNAAVHQYNVDPATGNYLSSQEISELISRPSVISGYSDYDLDMQELTRTATNAVRDHLKYARTVVAPDVIHFVEAIAPAIQEIARNPLHEIEVVVNNSFSFLNEPMLLDAIQKAKEITVTDVKLNFKHEARTDEQVLELMATGSASLDQAIALYASKLPEGTLAEVWGTMFTQVPQGGSDYKSFQQLLQEPGKDVTRALVTYLVARKLWNDAPDDSNMTARQYEDLMVEFRDQAALSLLRERYRQDIAMNAGLLVESIRDNKIIVNQNVYKEWIRNGGTNEVLFGLSLSRNPAQRVEVINENSEGYKLAWQNHVALSHVVIRNKRFERTKDLLEVEFKHYLENTPETEIGLQDRFEVTNRFKHALGKIKLDETDVDKLYTLVLKLLCAARYHRTDAEFILNAIQRVVKNNPEMDVREAASIATIEYIARWVGSQMKLDSARA